MSNSIDQKLGDSNSIPSLSFFWKAFFSDGSILEQFDNKGNEHRFQEVKDNFDKLIRFSLINKDYSQCFTVDLQSDLIIYNNYRNINLNNIEKKNNLRLIFFRRHRVEIGTQDLKEKKHTITYHLGYQYLKDGKNQKIILQIDENGNWILGDN
jgi:hypothetical protein